MPQITIEQALMLAAQHQQAMRFAQAEAIYRQVLSVAPESPDALHQLGVLLFQLDQPLQASELIARAISLNPSAPHYYSNYGRVLAELKRTDEAAAALHHALKLHPDYPEAWNNLGNVLQQTGEHLAAIDAFRRSLALRPDHPPTLLNLTDSLRQTAQFADAISTARRVMEMTGESGTNPDDPLLSEALCALGLALAESGEVDQGIDSYRRAITIAPDLAAAHFNLGLALLLKGELQPGWQELAWRWRMPTTRRERPNLLQPQWDGSNLNGQRILLYMEQGRGDMIQFSRYATLVAQRGGEVSLVTSPDLVRVLRTVEGVHSVVPFTDPLPQCDLHALMLDLPAIFQTGIHNVPSQVPYLKTDPTQCERWRSMLDSHRGKRKIGLVWAGNPQHRNDRHRTIPLVLFAPLAQVQDAVFVSLRLPQRLDAETSPLPLIDWTDQLNDFADTAALIENLDLVIAVDTAVAHLAAAMGKPVWVLLPRVPDWRWMLNRTDSPWYPTMRLFRQEHAGQWEPVIEEIFAELCRGSTG